MEYPKLVGGLNPSEKYWSIGMIIPNIWENKKCSKPPTRKRSWSLNGWAKWLLFLPLGDGPLGCKAYHHSMGQESRVTTYSVVQVEFRMHVMLKMRVRLLESHHQIDVEHVCLKRFTSKWVMIECSMCSYFLSSRDFFTKVGMETLHILKNKHPNTNILEKKQHSVYCPFAWSVQIILPNSSKSAINGYSWLCPHHYPRVSSL